MTKPITWRGVCGSLVLLVLALLCAWALWQWWPHAVLFLFRDVGMLQPRRPSTIVDVCFDAESRIQLLSERVEGHVLLSLLRLSGDKREYFPIAVELKSRTQSAILDIRYAPDAGAIWVVKHKRGQAETVAWLQLTTGLFVSREYGRQCPVASYRDLKFEGFGSDEFPSYAGPYRGESLGRASWER